MPIKSWFRNVKRVIEYEKQLQETCKTYFCERNKIYPLGFQDKMPNPELEQQIHKSICGIVYCPAAGVLLENAPDCVINKCDNFSADGNKRCTNQDCPVYNSNCAYFDAKEKYYKTIMLRNNAIRRVFGFRQK